MHQPPPISRRPPLLFAFLLLLTGAGAEHADAQASGTSPVFKSYRPPRPGAIVEQSDATYQLWHTFDLTRRAGAGDVSAQQELAVRYLTGRGAKADTARGAYWTMQAAAREVLPARFNLGILHANGWGVDWNPFEAYNQFLVCARRGMPEAQYAVATFLLEDLVVPKNLGEARRWVQAAADSGFGPARKLLETLHQQPDTAAAEPVGSGASSAKDTTFGSAGHAALPWSPVFLNFEPGAGSVAGDSILLADLMAESAVEDLRALGLSDTMKQLEETGPALLDALHRAADAGSPEALTLLGRCSERGIGVDRDPVKAAALYIRAIRLDSPRAPDLLLRLLEEPASMPLLSSRTASGDPVSCFVLASLVGLRLTHPLLRTGTWITDSEAVRLLQRSGSAGYVPALIELGLWYRAGRIVPRNPERALALWQDAAARGSVEAAVRIAATGLDTDLPPPEDLMRRLVEASGRGSVLAQMALGYCLERGKGIGRNSGGAARLYRIAAQRGSQDAYRALLRMHDALRPDEEPFRLPKE